MFSASSLSAGELSDDACNVDGSRSSPSKETVDMERSPPDMMRGRSPNKSLIQKRRRRFVEHRRARRRSIDKVGATCRSSPKSAATISETSPSCPIVGTSSNADSLNNDMEVELASLKAYKVNAVRVIKDYEATAQALEMTAVERDGEMEELKKEVDEKAKKYKKDIEKKNKEIKELEDMVIWSETTLATKLDELKDIVKMKDQEIIKLKSELLTIGALNDAELRKQIDDKVVKYEHTISVMAENGAKEVETHTQRIRALDTELDEVRE